MECCKLLLDKYYPKDRTALSVLPANMRHTGLASAKTCPHPASEHVTLSGTKVREKLAAGERPPKEFSRPEVADVLIGSMRK